MVDDGAHDDELLARAKAEYRLLLTSDRRLAERGGNDPTMAVLATGCLDDVASELSAGFSIDWLHAPFTRYLVDNIRLVPANDEHIAGLPATARQGAGPIGRCPRCGRVYWPASRRAPHAHQAGPVAERKRSAAL